MVNSQQLGIQKNSIHRVDSISNCNIGDEEDNDYKANTVSSNINMDNIETEGTGTATVGSIVRACNTDDIDQSHW